MPVKRRPKSITTPKELRRVIARLSVASPATDRFTAAWRRNERGQRERTAVWYTTQHEHWMGWLSGWSGPGGYGRQNWDRSARFVYNHIVNPQMLVYLAEAARLEDELVEKATAAALTNCSTMMSMSAAVRRVIPWKIVEQALLKC